MHLQASPSSLSKTTSRDDMFEKLLLEEELLKLTMTTASLLILESEDCVDNFEKQFSVAGKEAFIGSFSENLMTLVTTLKKRNKAGKKAGKSTYSYLNPSAVPASIDILEKK